MKRLHLLRHAHAAAGDPTGNDHDRPLSSSGREECRALGAGWRQAGLAVDIVLCSPAVRAAQTFELLKAAVPQLPEADYQPKLYLASPVEILKVLKNSADGATDVLIVGHNPGLHELALSLCRGESCAERLDFGLPTATLLSFEAECDRFADLPQAGAKLVRLQRPG